MVQLLSRTIGSWMADESGASLVEYILLVALVAVVSVAAITFLGASAKKKFEFTASTIAK